MNKISARPGLNGNSPKDFIEASEALFRLAGVTKKQIAEQSREVLNLRNYQHLPADPHWARLQDVSRIHAILTALDDLAYIAIELNDAGEQS